MVTVPQRKLTKKYFIKSTVLLLAFLLVFIICANQVKENQLQQFDFMVIEFVQSRISQVLTVWMKAITFFGGKAWLVPALLVSSIAVAFFKKRYGIYLFLTTGTGALLNALLKQWFQRERPNFYTLITQGGYSFPSGHSMSSFIFYISLAIVLAKISRWKSVDVVITILFVCLVFAIGISRIYLGVHFPSDVLAGFAAGGFWVCFCTIVLNYFEKRQDAL